jgi:hypothetical protein
MTQEERWNARYEEVREFILKNKWNPSKHRIEEHQMLNFIKHNRKLVNKGEMRSERVEKFKELMELCERNRRKNQYV